jgi:hypothetical protein
MYLSDIKLVQTYYSLSDLLAGKIYLQKDTKVSCLMLFLDSSAPN